MLIKCAKLVAEGEVIECEGEGLNETGRWCDV